MIDEKDVLVGLNNGLYVLSKKFNRICVKKTVCLNCEKTVYVRSHRLNKNKHFCSINCRLKTYPMGGENHPNWGKKINKNTRRKISLAQKGEKGNNWKGGEIVQNGYNAIQDDKNGYIATHRVIAARVLGRPLKSNEVVHHINMNKTDNRNDNLLICDKGYHSFLHFEMQKAWLRHIGL